MELREQSSMMTNLLFFGSLIFVVAVVGFIWSRPIANIYIKFIVAILVVGYSSSGAIYAYYTYKITIPNNLIYRWQGGLYFFFILCFTVWAFADIYCQAGLISGNSLIQGNMQACIYFSTLTLFGVSFGDVIPSGNARFFAAVQVILGYFYLAFIIAITVDILQSNSRQR